LQVSQGAAGRRRPQAQTELDHHIGPARGKAVGIPNTGGQLRGTAAEDQADLWDSGKVASDQSTQIECARKPLESRQRCYWKVGIWDTDGNPSPWSEPSCWMMGFLKPKDWQAKWITMKVSDGLAHPWLRRTFELKSDITPADVCVNTRSHYELYLHGRKVGSDVLVPVFCVILEKVTVVCGGYESCHGRRAC